MRIKCHDAYADELTDCILETGAHVRREAWIKEFATPGADAVLDIWAFGAVEVADLLVDVTIRHPQAAAYQTAASHEPGCAAAVVTEQKDRRYPPPGGRVVTPFAVETWGRLSSDAEHVLETLASAATRYASMRGHAPAPGGCLKRWRAALDTTLQRGVAMALISARTGLPGKQHVKKRA